MLGKVMKYEFRSCGRLLLPFFGAALGLSVVVRLLLVLSPLVWEPLGMVVTTLATSLGVFALAGVIGLCIVYVIVRFYQSMAASEAYLTFTLPVSVNTHLVGRLLVGTIYSLLSFVVAFACALIFLPGFAANLFSNPSISVNLAGVSHSIPLSGIPANIWLSLIGALVALILISLVSTLLQVYGSLALGTRLSSNRILGGVAGFLLLNTGESLLSLPLVMPIMFLFGEDDMLAYTNSLLAGDTFQAMRNILGAVWVVIGLVLLLNLLFGVLHYLLCRHYFGKRLNLE